MKFLKVEDLVLDTQIKVVTLNRPEVKNAFNPEMIAEITTTFQNFNKNKEIKAVIINGEGSVFCAGADLNWMKEMAKYTYEQNIQDSQKLWNMFEAVINCEVPVIGIAHGAVYGGAIGLLACCDSVYAETNTKFCFSEVKLGLSPAVISSFVLRKLSDAFVRPFMLSAEVFNATKASAIGLVHDTFQGSANLAGLANLYSPNGLEAMRETKKLLNAISNNSDRSEHAALTTQVISERRISKEGQQRLQKFLSKS
ncbi:MAG: enoyl-CoA hydratase/isomerase family protein [Bdellovibrionaceae bacterium]|nr:enoyl-CoA hydratase/isomerase family protein [Bdellovibrio sp.]